MKLTASFLRHHRRLVVIGIGSLLVLFCVGYGLLSWGAWAGQNATYQSWHDSTQVTVDKALVLPTASGKERTQKLVALTDASKAIMSKKDSICRPHSLVAWQQNIIPNLKAQQETCQKKATTLSVLGANIQVTVDYLKDDQAVAKIIATAAGSTDTFAEDTWEGQVKQWHVANESLKKLKVSAAFTPVKTVSAAKVGAVETAWQNVVTSSQAKNKALYLDAQAKLTEAYGGLTAISEATNGQLTVATTSLQVAYDATFK